MRKNCKEFKKKKDLKLFRRKLLTKFKKLRKRIGLQNLNRFQKALFLRNEKVQRNFDIVIVCPKVFSLLKDKEGFIKFINKIELAGRSFKSMYFDMILIREIDFSGITCLISILLTLKKKRISFEGSIPIEPGCRDFLLKSDFFTHLANLTFNSNEDVNVELANKTSNFITKGRKMVSPDIAGDANIMVSQHFFKEQNFVNDGLQVILLELMANTNNHAAVLEGSEHWFLSVQFDQKDTVKFNFVDYGVGIFKSLETKNILDKLKHFFTSNHECLKQMLIGQYHIKTSTGLDYRGKGIPSLRTAMMRNHVKNLIIVTNDVYGDIENDIFARNISNFSGTFISWEVTKNNDFININI